MVWAKIVILIVFMIVLATCLVMAVNPESVGPSVINNSNKSKLENSHLLTSVYDAIKYNHKAQLADDMPDSNLERIGPPVLIATDNRNKRNTNNIDRSEYYYTNPYDTYSSNYIQYNGNEDQYFIPKSDMLCHNRALAKENDFKISITPEMSSIKSVVSTVGKIIFGFIAVLVLPFIILKALLIPIKILLGVKAFTVVNSLFFGAMVWRFLRNLTIQNSDDNQDDEDVDDGSSLPSLSNINQINSDFGEIDVKRILKYVKEKDKDW